MGRTWGRLYAGTRNHRKIKILRQCHPTMWTSWYVLIELAIECDDDGWVYVAPDRPYTWRELAQELGTTRADNAERLVRTLIDLGLAAYTEGKGIRLTSYSERNYESDYSAPRVRKYRERKRTEDQDVTLQERFGNGLVTESVTHQNRTEQNRTEQRESTAKSGICDHLVMPTTAPPDGDAALSPKTPKPKKTNGYDPEFEELWSVVESHRKGPKTLAAKEWLTVKNSAPASDLADIYRRQRQEKARLRDAGQFAPEFPDLHRWLKKGYWQNEPLLPNDPYDHPLPREQPSTLPPLEECVYPRPGCPECGGKGLTKAGPCSCLAPRGTPRGTNE